MKRPNLTQLFSFIRDAGACPSCGWETFWQHPNCGHDANVCAFQCERCHRILRDRDLVTNGAALRLTFGQDHA